MLERYEAKATVGIIIIVKMIAEVGSLTGLKKRRMRRSDNERMEVVSVNFLST